MVSSLDDIPVRNAANNVLNDLKPKVINISSQNLNISQIKLMCRDPKFGITPDKPDLLNLQVGIKDLARKLQIKKFFHGIEKLFRFVHFFTFASLKSKIAIFVAETLKKI